MYYDGTLLQSGTVHPYGRVKTDTSPGGWVEEERDHGEGRELFVCLL